MFKRMMLLALIIPGAIAMAMAARAADLPVKNPAAALPAFGSVCTPTSCTGFYVGGGLGGVGTNLDIIGNGLNGSAGAGGMLPTFDVGYLYANGNWLFGAEASFAYQTNTAATLANAVSGNQSGILLTQGVKVGGNMAALLGNLGGGVAPITIPPSLANAVISPYLQGGAAEHQLAGGGMASGQYGGVGVLFDVGPHSFVDIDYKNIQYGSTKSGAASFNQQNVITAKWNYKF